MFFVLFAGIALWKEQQQQGDNNSTGNLLRPSVKRLVHSSCACLRKGVEILGRRLKVKYEGS
jgi:hypothetical protein